MHHRDVLALQRLDGVEKQLEGGLLLARHGIAHSRCAGRRADVLVVDELVAVRREQIARRLPHPHANHRLAVLLEAQHERREVGVARHDREGVDVLLGVGELHRVHHEPDVCRVLPGHPPLGDLGELDAKLVKRPAVRLEPAPVRVRPLRDDLALLHEALEHALHVDGLGGLAGPRARAGTLVHSQREILEVDEHGE